MALNTFNEIPLHKDDEKYTNRRRSRRKSCLACVQAKRRCDRILPQCARCLEKGIECAYTTRLAVAGSSLPCDPDIAAGWLEQSPNQQVLQSGYSAVIGAGSFDFPVFHSPAPPIIPASGDCGWLYQPLPDERTLFQVLGTPDDNRADYCLRVLKGYPETFVREGRLDFLHQLLYRDSSPKAIQDAYCICSIYLTKTESNENMVYRIIDSKVNALLEPHSSWTYVVNLACVQALILVQIIRLFDGNIRQRALAEHLEVILDLWTEQLRRRTVEELPPMWSAHHVWVFVESARRTVLISFVLRGLYSLLKTGICQFASTMRTLPLNACKRLWDSLSSNDWPFAGPQTRIDSTVTWEEFTTLWQKGQVSNIGPFESLLLVVCRGEDSLEGFGSFAHHHGEVLDGSSYANNPSTQPHWVQTLELPIP